jgi:uncharacterized protein
MKMLLLLAALALGLWLWRSGRGAASSHSQPKPSAKPAPKAQEMIPCTLCQMHVPQAEAIAGKQGSYCCEQHRRQAES